MAKTISQSLKTSVEALKLKYSGKPVYITTYLLPDIDIPKSYSQDVMLALIQVDGGFTENTFQDYNKIITRPFDVVIRTSKTISIDETEIILNGFINKIQDITNDVIDNIIVYGEIANNIVDEQQRNIAIYRISVGVVDYLKKF